MTVEQKNRTEALLIEVGIEEIPARFLAGAEQNLGERLTEALQNLRLLSPDAQPVTTYSTPRRLVARTPQILARQPDETEEVIGPPAKVAFDQTGNPTRAATSFAERNSTRVSRLLKIETPKGLYLGLRRRVRGRSAREVLAEALPQVILGISFPKSMYWTSKADPRFIRPIRWLLAILAENENARVVPFEIAGIRSRKSTYGHRVAGSKAIPVKSFEKYAAKLREHQVEIDRGKRSEMIRREVKAVLEGMGLSVFPDEDLHEWVINSTEWPHAILGGFDRRFLHLPREILVTVMRDHQKYFAVENEAGELQPNFVTVMNLGQDAAGLIREGHERVLRARFADAEFFWEADQRVRLAERQEMLAKVTYQANLGSYADKIRRMVEIAKEICRDLESQRLLDATSREHALRAVHLCKCDLTTQMVREFTELQGVVGGLYAREQGEPEAVADAIYDHYKPANIADECPRDKIGAVVALADRLDSVLAGFAVGLVPTGSSDPFGLRRAGNGIIKIAIEMFPTLNLSSLIGSQAVRSAWAHFPGRDLDTVLSQLRPFLQERLEFYLRDLRGLRYDTVRAVLSYAVSKGMDAPAAALARAQALEQVRDTEDFLALAAAAKRTRNILTKSAGVDHAGGEAAVDAALLSEDAERNLYARYRGLTEVLESLEGRSDYLGSFRAMAAIRPQVDLFFDKVLVMTEDPAVRENRLRLLIGLNRDVFTRLAELSEIAIEARS
ncbi:MAG TPA: glycine--tRNA ligase subunit beta [Terriglobia bacterium]|nr:glycine--tRNA ligase subunit beta [Terriglobia bacterium]